MPTYTVKDPRTGRTVKLTGDSPPSEAELNDIFAKLNPANVGASRGLVEPGNIDLAKQPKVKNPDGGVSTVFSSSYNIDGNEVLLPSVTPDGRFLRSPNEVIGEYKKTGRHLGKFSDPESATAYAEQLHNDYASGKYDPPRSWGDTAVDVVKGAAKGAVSTVSGLGDIARKIPGVSSLDRLVTPIPVNTTPTNTAQSVGKGVEQVGEFFLPTGLVGKAAKVADVAKAGLLTAGQTHGDLASVGVSAGLAAVPFGSLANKAGNALKGSALETMANSLRATKEWAKSEAERLAPEMLKRGIGGSIKSLRTQAAAMAGKVGKNLSEAYDAAAAEGATVPGLVIRGNLQLASDGLHTLGANGSRVAIPGNTSAIASLKELDDFVAKLGDDIPVNQAATLKRAFDEIVSKAGLYGQNATAPASEKAAAWSYREAANSFRELLNTNPTIADLNKEASFWIGLRDVVDATKLRKVGQTGGLMAAGSGGAGAVIGAMSGDSTGDKAKNALLGGLAGRQVVRVLQSPAFMNSVSAPLKNALADALASGSQGRVISATSRILSSLPAQARTAMAQ